MEKELFKKCGYSNYSDFDDGINEPPRDILSDMSITRTEPDEAIEYNTEKSYKRVIGYVKKQD